MNSQFASLGNQRADHNSHFPSPPACGCDSSHESNAGNSSLPRGSGWFEGLKRWFTPAPPQGLTVTVCSPPPARARSRTNVFHPHPAGSFVALCVSAGFCEPTEDGRPVFRLVYRTTARRPDGCPHVIGSRFIGPFGENHRLWRFLGHWRGCPLTLAERETGIDYDQLVGCSGLITVVRDTMYPAKASRIRRLLPCPAGLGRGLTEVFWEPEHSIHTDDCS